MNTEQIERLLLIAEMARNETLTPSLVEYATIDACEAGADALREKQERENPQPLTLDELKERIDKLERERDKAVEDMTAMSNLSEGVETCEFCKWYRNEDCQKPGMFNISACFEWRGIKEGE